MQVHWVLGDSDEGVTCVKFGMLADEKDLSELITLVLSKGKEIEESSQVHISQMGEPQNFIPHPLPKRPRSLFWEKAYKDRVGV